MSRYNRAPYLLKHIALEGDSSVERVLPFNSAALLYRLIQESCVGRYDFLMPRTSFYRALDEHKDFFPVAHELGGVYLVKSQWQKIA